MVTLYSDRSETSGPFVSGLITWGNSLTWVGSMQMKRSLVRSQLMGRNSRARLLKRTDKIIPKG